ncbi:MAG: hypothetical protein IJ240_01995 [Clostridia bacterium]|nr:hypothetical protein [Clostridia bacterium]
MKNYLILTRLMVRNTLSSMNPFTGSYRNRKAKIGGIAKTILFGLLILGALASVVYVEYKLSEVLDSMRQRVLLPALAVLFATAGTLIMGLFQGISELYQGKDAPWLAVLPLTSRQVFAARLTNLYLGELALNLPLVVPAFILYMRDQPDLGALIVRGILILFLLPLIPLAIVSLLSALLMRVSAFARHRETVTMILSLILAVAYSAAVSLMNSRNMSEQSSTMYLISLLLNNQRLMNDLLSLFPPARWAAHGFMDSWPQLLLFLGVSVASIAAVLLSVGPGYLSAALSQSEHTSARKVKKAMPVWKSSSQLMALRRLEWRELLRTPSWAYNGLAGVFMFPVMITIGVLAGTASVGLSRVAELLNETISEAEPGYVIVILAATLSMGNMVNPAVATAFSREGGRYPFSLSLPVPQKKRFIAKLMVGLEINLMCTGMIALVCLVLFRLPVLPVVAAFVLSTVLGFTASTVCMCVDAAKPVLKWMNESQAIKKNFNSFFGMILWVIFLAVCVFVVFKLWRLGGTAVLLGATGVIILEAVAAWIVLCVMANKKVWLPENL